MRTSDLSEIKRKNGLECSSPRLRELITDYALSEISETQARRLEDHLIVCLGCRRSYLRFKAIIRAARRDPDKFFPASPIKAGEFTASQNSSVRDRS